MSSIQDQEMWMWKNEPVSPSGTSLLDVDEDWPFNDQSVDISNNAAEVVMYDDHPNRAQVAKKLLEQLDEWIKEEYDEHTRILKSCMNSCYLFKLLSENRKSRVRIINQNIKQKQ